MCIHILDWYVQTNILTDVWRAHARTVSPDYQVTQVIGSIAFPARWVSLACDRCHVLVSVTHRSSGTWYQTTRNCHVLSDRCTTKVRIGWGWGFILISGCFLHLTPSSIRHGENLKQEMGPLGWRETRGATPASHKKPSKVGKTERWGVRPSLLGIAFFSPLVALVWSLMNVFFIFLLEF
jgi:hypothetical protein